MAFNYNKLDDLCLSKGIELKKDEILSKYTGFRTGGPTDRMVIAKSEDELKALLELINESEYNYFILGRGSDMLALDEGYRGIVIRLDGEFSKISLLEDGLTVECGAGASLASLCIFARDNCLSGLEFAWGIPGSCGGAVYMNAGAYGGEIKDVAVKCEYLTKTGEKGEFSLDEMKLTYRHSVFSDSDMIITKAYFKLKSADKAEIVTKMDELIGKRKAKQPLEYPSAGSTFKRPEGYFAAALIEECGLKGESIGGAEVSEKHSGFIINKNNATAEDVLKLIEKVKTVVLNEKGVELECEVRILK